MAEILDAMQQRIEDMAIGAMTLNLIGIGDDLKLFRHLAEKPLTSAGLALRAECSARYMAEWCLHMAAVKILTYDEATDSFKLPGDVAPVFLDPAYERCMAMASDTIGFVSMRPELSRVFRTGEGISWGAYPDLVFSGARRSFPPIYREHLVDFLPDEVCDMLNYGGMVADVGCGEGASTTILAAAFAKAQFRGYDRHAPSVRLAQQAAREQHLENVLFFIADGNNFAGKCGDGDAGIGEVDLCMFINCFHDISDADLAAKQAYEALRDGGVLFLMEPDGADEPTVAAQLALPACAGLSGASCHICLPSGLHNNGCGMGICAPTSLHKAFLEKAGFIGFAKLNNAEAEDLGFRLLLAHKPISGDTSAETTMPPVAKRLKGHDETVH